MRYRCLLGGALVALAAASVSRAQFGGSPASPATPIFLQQTFTTGMVGFTTNQTARLNVLNLNSTAAMVTSTLFPPAAPANCTVELQFFDDKNNLVKQAVVPNFAPGAATSLDLPRSGVTSVTAARAQIRGAVVVNPSPTPVASPAAVGFCSVMTTLEVFDSSGSTVALTSDTRMVGFPMPMPLIPAGPR